MLMESELLCCIGNIEAFLFLPYFYQHIMCISFVDNKWYMWIFINVVSSAVYYLILEREVVYINYPPIIVDNVDKVDIILLKKTSKLGKN